MLRPDQRSATELRPVSIERHFTKYAPGSVRICCGDTHILCTATIKDDVPRFRRGSGLGWLTAEYRMLPSATRDRHDRELLRVGGRTAEIQRLIGRSLRAAIDFEALGERTLTLDADVLQADGGTRTAAITGGYVALVDACRWLLTEGLIETLPLKHQVAAVSVGIVDATERVDLCAIEDNQASVDLNIVMTATQQLIEVQGTAEQEPFSLSQLNTMLAIATPAIASLMQQQNAALNA